MTNETNPRTRLAPPIRRAIPALVLSIAPLLAASAAAQPLPAACSNGGPNYQPCLQHVTVLTGDFFTDTPAFPAGGPVGLSFHDLLSNWLYGGPARQVQPDFNAGPLYAPSNC